MALPQPRPGEAPGRVLWKPEEDLQEEKDTESNMSTISSQADDRYWLIDPSHQQHCQSLASHLPLPPPIILSVYIKMLNESQ